MKQKKKKSKQMSKNNIYNFKILKTINFKMTKTILKLKQKNNQKYKINKKN